MCARTKAALLTLDTVGSWISLLALLLCSQLLEKQTVELQVHKLMKPSGVQILCERHSVRVSSITLHYIHVCYCFCWEALVVTKFGQPDSVPRNSGCSKILPLYDLKHTVCLTC